MAGNRWRVPDEVSFVGSNDSDEWQTPSEMPAAASAWEIQGAENFYTTIIFSTFNRLAVNSG